LKPVIGSVNEQYETKGGVNHGKTRSFSVAGVPRKRALDVDVTLSAACTGEHHTFDNSPLKGDVDNKDRDR
jgi:hypothetical protein